MHKLVAVDTEQTKNWTRAITILSQQSEKTTNIYFLVRLIPHCSVNRQNNDFKSEIRTYDKLT